MPKLFLLRHLKSQWNLENRFSGWVDVPLMKDTEKRVKEITKKIFQFKIDAVYSSPLYRNQRTVGKILEFADKKYPIFVHLDKGRMKDWGNFRELNKNYIPVFLSEALNERCYGKLQGLDKKETIKKYGEKLVHLWRRSYEVVPPGGESLKDVVGRTTPFYKKYIEKDLKLGKNILVVSSHNSLRAILKYVEKTSNEDIVNVEIPFAGLVIYDLDRSLKLKKKTII
jgi:2,3-bisphosphoglycerate-dependent phosphoglycerate mutase